MNISDDALAANPMLWLNMKGTMTNARNQIVVDAIVRGAPFPIDLYHGVFARYWYYTGDGPIGEVHDDPTDRTGVYLSPAAIAIFAQNAKCYTHLPSSARTEVNILRAFVQGNMIENAATFGRLRLDHFECNVNPLEVLYNKLYACGRYAEVRRNLLWLELTSHPLFRHMPIYIGEDPDAPFNMDTLDEFLAAAKKQLNRAKKPIPSVLRILREVISARTDLATCVYFSSFKLPVDCWSLVCDYLTHRVPLPLLRELDVLSVQLRDPVFLQTNRMFPTITHCSI